MNTYPFDWLLDVIKSSNANLLPITLCYPQASKQKLTTSAFLEEKQGKK